MIRINLVAGERRSAKAAGPSMQIGQKITVAGSLIVIIALVAIGWRFWALNQRANQATQDIDSAKREETRLAEVLKNVSDFEAQRAQLQQRVTLIDELRRGQSAPVHMVDQISRSLPEMMWLTSIKQTDYDLEIKGRCTTLPALSDFVSNLEATRYFKRPVEIVESEVVASRDNSPDLIEFTIKGTFQMAGIEQPKPAPTKKGPAKGGKVG